MKELLAKAEEKMDKSLNALDREFKAVRAGRANPAVLDKVLVDYYGTPTPVQQMAAVSVPREEPCRFSLGMFQPFVILKRLF